MFSFFPHCEAWSQAIKKEEKKHVQMNSNYGLQLHNEEKKKIIRIQIQTLSLLYLYFEKNLQ